MKGNRLGTGALCALVLLAGCKDKQPAGQVVATVNGKEVTLQELNTELQSANVPANADKQQAQRALLQRVIERKLVDGLAEEKNLDDSPEYLAQKRRLEETLLGQIYVKKQLAAVPVPSEADIAKFMGEHPEAFANRQQLTLDQIRFAAPSNLEQVKGLEGTHSMEAVASYLTSRGIKFDRAQVQLDSAQIPAEMMARINALPATEPFVVPTGGMFTINVIVGRKAVAGDPAQAKSVAVGAWRQQQVQKMLTDQINAAKAKAKISYQKGYEPPAPAKGAAGAPAGVTP